MFPSYLHLYLALNSYYYITTKSIELIINNIYIII